MCEDSGGKIMANIVVVGAQWGDEGKGKIVDLLTERFDVVARCQGGHNAGHTVIIDGAKYVLHLIPSGILHRDKVCVIGNGVVVDPFALLQELDALAEFGIEGRLFISDRCHLILPYHKAIEGAEEARLADRKIGTTSRGIGPCYEDKIARRGIRIGDLAFPDQFAAQVRDNLAVKNRILECVYGCSPVDADDVITTYLGIYPRLAPFITDTAEYLSDAIRGGKSVLFEGAQGAMLDIDHGTYPFVTSSNATAGGACTGTGVGPSVIHGVVGICKAYTTRVGGGPFPTELEGELGETIRRKGAEFGASTGRPRRCGWFDAVVVRYSCRLNSINTLVMTKLDVLDEVDEIKVCTGYRCKGELLRGFPGNNEILDLVEPVYEVHPGWKSSTSGICRLEDLPAPARAYLSRLSELVQTDIAVVSTGPDRKETIWVEESSGLRLLRG